MASVGEAVTLSRQLQLLEQKAKLTDARESGRVLRPRDQRKLPLRYIHTKPPPTPQKRAGRRRAAPAPQSSSAKADQVPSTGGGAAVKTARKRKGIYSDKDR